MENFVDFVDNISPELMAKTCVVGHLGYGRDGSFQWCWRNPRLPEEKKKRAYLALTAFLAAKMPQLAAEMPETEIRRIDDGDWTFLAWCDTCTDVKVRMFERKWLDNQIQKSANGIRFEDKNGKLLFKIADGDCIRTTAKTGEQQDWRVRYIDDSHFEVAPKRSNDGPYNVYHRMQFAQWVPGTYTVIPLRESLPEECVTVFPKDGKLTVEDVEGGYKVSAGELRLVKIRRGELGFYGVDGPDFSDLDFGTEGNLEYAARENRANGVTEAQEAAMVAGAMFGWDSFLADPANYDDNGEIKASAVKEAMRNGYR